MDKKILAVITLIVIASGGAGYAMFGAKLVGPWGKLVEHAKSQVPLETPGVRSEPTEVNAPTPVKTLRYPSLTNASFEHEDYTVLDETVAIRKYVIPTGQGTSIDLITAYQSSFASNENPSRKITWIADTDAAFSSSYQQSFGSVGKWDRVTVDVGDFAQDYCGDVKIVYTFEHKEVIAIRVGNSHSEDSVLKDSACSLQFDSENSTSTETDGSRFGQFCQSRARCLKDYFSLPDNAHKLNAPFLPIVRDLEFK